MQIQVMGWVWVHWSVFGMQHVGEDAHQKTAIIWHIKSSTYWYLITKSTNLCMVRIKIMSWLLASMLVWQTTAHKQAFTLWCALPLSLLLEGCVVVIWLPSALLSAATTTHPTSYHGSWKCLQHQASAISCSNPARTVSNSSKHFLFPIPTARGTL